MSNDRNVLRVISISR